MFSTKASNLYTAITLTLLITALAVLIQGCAVKTGGRSSSASKAPSSTSACSSGSSVQAASSSTAAVTESRPQGSASSSETASVNNAKYVTLTIDATKGEDGIAANAKKVEIKSGDTVYSLLKRYCDENQILLSAKKSGAVYVEAIDGVAEFGYGAESGWIYSVNGVFSKTNCGTYKLSGGETVKWVYTTDLGKSEGASS